MSQSTSNHANRLQQLSQIEIFSSLEDVDLQLLMPLTRREVYSRRRHIYLPEDPSNTVFFLVEGKVRIARLSRDGKEVTLALLTPGDVFGEQAIVDDGPRGTLAEAVEDATVYAIDRESFEEFVRRRPEVAYRLTRVLIERQRSIETRIEELAFRDVPTRLARLLVRLSRNYGGRVPEGTVIDLPLTHQELANLIGATRETTTATLNGFRRAGVLTLGRKRIVITDGGQLDKLAFNGVGPDGGSKPVGGDNKNNGV